MPQKPPKPSAPLIIDSNISPDISMQQERLIGRVVVAWSKLEQAMHGVIWALLDMDPDDGRIVTGKQDAKHKIAILRGLGKKHLSEQAQPRFIKLPNISEKLYVDRNFVAHGSWGTDMNRNIAIAATLRERPAAEDGDPTYIVTQYFSPARMRVIAHRMALSASRCKQPSQPAKT